MWIEVNGERQTVKPHAPAKFDVASAEVVEIRSNFPYPRPTVFSHKGALYDCHHG